ncbi:MAG TPA: T9SS type A sorting domain-containing protein, partial [Niastella sp.]|nr:T9SS type A sorting domain-containing protein [Niastella sp.]
PGVGKGAPTGFVLPTISYSSVYNDIVLKFSVYVFDANLKCSSSKPFECPTFVKAYLVPTTWNDPLGTPTAAQYYAAQDYQILYPNTSNTIVFSNIALPAGVTCYRVLLNFKTADNSNCTSSGTKFIFDDFGANSSSCNSCSPVANADYFNSDIQSLFAGSAHSFKGNVYGGYSLWATQAPSSYETGSLTLIPAVNNGTDYDLNNSSLSNATFAVSTPLAVEASNSGCGTPNPGTLQFNSNGTFTYTKGSACVKRVSFSYTLSINPYGASPATKVFIDMPGQQLILPVHFKSFTATRKDKQVILKWETASEQNNKGFYLQRSMGGGEWKDIAFMFSQNEDGYSSADISYSYTDLNAAKGVSLYRILQVDRDGQGHYSETRSVQGNAAQPNMTLFPNPSTTGNVTLLLEADGPKNITVMDVAGRPVRQYKNMANGNLDIKALGDGFYTVQVADITTGILSIEKIIIKKR